MSIFRVCKIALLSCAAVAGLGIAGILGCVLFHDPVYRACAKCGTIMGLSEECPCHVAICKWHGWRYLEIAKISFYDMDRKMFDVEVPISGEFGCTQYLQRFCSAVILPECDFKKNGYVFDKWKKLGAGSNAMFSAGESVTIISNSTFVAVWKKK